VQLLARRRKTPLRDDGEKRSGLIDVHAVIRGARSRRALPRSYSDWQPRPTTLGPSSRKSWNILQEHSFAPRRIAMPRSIARYAPAL
jgi:hypothetical protein